ncbi:MAG: T9SS type A sorting domain-containing protein [Bacteroidetes bacterium]|nr:T9SS type A sorting domain-containing protein [Bacteroidota bacterium]
METKLYFNTSEEFSIRIYDALGREMVKLDGLKESPFVISRKNLKAGIYFIHLIQNNELKGQEKMVVLD